MADSAPNPITAAELADRVPDVVIITGMSGSGRTQAMHVFEDMGYFCIDNLPPRLFLQLAELVGINAGIGRHLAVTCDLRSQGLFDELQDAIKALADHEMSCRSSSWRLPTRCSSAGTARTAAATRSPCRGRPRPTRSSASACSCGACATART